MKTRITGATDRPTRRALAAERRQRPAATYPIGFAELRGHCRRPDRATGREVLVTVDRMPAGIIRICFAAENGLTWVTLPGTIADRLRTRLADLLEVTP